jgi:surfactin synthase thioesterase subunit
LVFCFPGAGIRAEELPLPDAVDTELFVYRPVEWRGANALVPPGTVEEMVNHAYDAIRDDLDQRFVFYGNCLGAIVAYELARRLQQGGRGPDHLLVAGAVGPHKYVAPDAQTLPGAKLLELLGVLRYPWAERLRTDPAFRDGRLDAIRADLGAMAAYEYRRADPLDDPITAVSLRPRCDVVEWEGDHYFAMRHPDRIHELVTRAAAGGHDRPGGSAADLEEVGIGS